MIEKEENKEKGVEISYYHFLNKEKIEKALKIDEFSLYSSLVKKLILKNNCHQIESNFSKEKLLNIKEENLILNLKNGNNVNVDNESKDYNVFLTEKEINILEEHFIKYLTNEVNKLNKKYREITLCEKMSEYVTFILIKNKNLLKKEFKKILIELNEALQLRDGGDLINIQFKDVNLLIYVHKN